MIEFKAELHLFKAVNCVKNKKFPKIWTADLSGGPCLQTMAVQSLADLGGGCARCTPPHFYRTQFFWFCIHFWQKVPALEVHGSPLMGPRPSTRNPGSATVNTLLLRQQLQAGDTFTTGLDTPEYRTTEVFSCVVMPVSGHIQCGETDLIQRIDSDVTNMNAISKCFIAIPWKFKCPLTCPIQNSK